MLLVGVCVGLLVILFIGLWVLGKGLGIALRVNGCRVWYFVIRKVYYCLLNLNFLISLFYVYHFVLKRTVANGRIRLI